MKIVLVNQAHPTFGGPGGAERSVKTLAEGLARRGHDVTSLAMAQAADIEHLSESGIHSEHRISGVRTVLLGKKSRSTTEVEMIASLVKRDPPDIVHTNTFWHNNDLWREINKIGVPIVHTLREYKLACDRNMFDGSTSCLKVCDSCKLHARVGQERSNLVRSVVGISRYVLDRHLELGFFSDTPLRVVIHNPVGGNAAAALKGPSISGPLRLGYLGRLHPTKGIGHLIEAVLKRVDDRIHLTAAGEVQDRDVSRQIALAEGDPRFEYLGFVEPGQLFDRVDVLCVPSAWPEPFGRIVIESFLHGVPVLAANGGALPELVTPGETGWIANNLDAALEQLLVDRDRLPGMRAACLSAAEQYRPALIAEKYEQQYVKTIAARSSAVPARNGPRYARLFDYLAGRRPVGRRNAVRTKPSVLVVVGEFPKLSETFVISHITGLLDLGVDVTIFAERMGDSDQWHDDVDRYLLTDRTLWYGLPVGLRSARDYLCRTSASIRRELTDLLEHSSIVSMPPPLDRLARSLIDEQARTETKLRLFNAAAVLAHVRKSFDIVHCHFGHRGLFAAELKRMGVLSGKIAVSFHGIDMTEHVAKKGIHVYEALKTDADLLLPVSNFFRERLLRLGMSPRKTYVHHVGIDCGKFALKERRVVDNETVKLLSVGRLVPKKGIEYAVRAIGLLKERGERSRFHLDVVGDGPERPTLTRLVEKLKLTDHVTFHGACSHAQVRAHMERSHIFLAPSVTAADGDMEGVPTTIMEAMASGMPVISTVHSGIPELVQDGESGLLCRERDFRQLADRIGFLLTNRELWPEFGRQGRKTVEADFNIRRQNARALDLYEELLAVASPRDHEDLRAVG